MQNFWNGGTELIRTPRKGGGGPGGGGSSIRPNVKNPTPWDKGGPRTQDPPLPDPLLLHLYIFVSFHSSAADI